ncbi:hypothetical protein [Sphingobacterium kitahiroshimense]|uniref:NACHT domain-containing protein n=1 Tax=Sphingobacterium kitahiroshimense TaxID=470446 RepID=A0ABV0C162_9SPHI
MRHALTGYTYQHDVAYFFLTKIDVERQIKKIEIEADVDHQFDDVFIETENEKYFIQIKDFANANLESLEQNGNEIKIGNTWHKLSSHTNIIFFKEIDITPNCNILGLNAYRHNQTYIISMNRESLGDSVYSLYHNNESRERIILQFFKKQLDQRIWHIEITDLPTVTIFNKKLTETTINVGRKKLISNNLLFIEGKPGIGKSHYVNELIEEYSNNLLYRFWVSNQDNNRETRLNYNSFLFDISKELFGNQVHFSENEIIKEIKKSKKVIIIDGLDHVENYNPKDLEHYIAFIDKIHKHNITIVLSRPLVRKTYWNKHILSNWNKKQTEKILDELYYIDDYRVSQGIYKITKGYPILVRYIGEHYKKYKKLPEIDTLNDIDQYYSQLIERQKSRLSFAIFLCSNAYYMQSEILRLMGNEYGELIMEFIDTHPYLFEIRLNRIALFHDSFNTYLRKNIVEYKKIENNILDIVGSSIIAGEQRYISRINSFNLDSKTKEKILIQYSDIEYFKQILSKTIDIDALRSFYEQLQENLSLLDCTTIETLTIYNLSLVLNILNRDHVSTLNEFLYTYLSYLRFAGYTEEDITSNNTLFAMLFYIKTGDNTLLYNIHSDRNYDVAKFAEKIEVSIGEEQEFFNHYIEKWPADYIHKLVEYAYDEYTYERWKEIFVNLYLYKYDQEFDCIKNIITHYIDKDEDKAINLLEDYFDNRNFRTHNAARILRDAKDLIFALGHKHTNNDYVNLDFDNFIIKNKIYGSYDLWVKVLNYLRLALHKKRKIDIYQIHQFWAKYYNRHDYSFVNIVEALPIFEDLNYITQNQSIDLITKIQSQSEKGYRHLFNNYIKNKPFLILEDLANNFYLSDLHIDWFLLPSKFLNQLPDRIFKHEIRQTIHSHRSSQELDIRDVLNVIHSKRITDLKKEFDKYGFKIRINENEKKELAYLKKKHIKHVTYKDDQKFKRETSKQRFLKGILMDEDINFVKKHFSSPAEIAKYRDDYYTVLSEIELYKVFDKSLVRGALKQIFINALTTKAKDANYYGRLYYFPGNVIKMINDYDSNTDLKPFYNSFKKYIELSSFEI